MKLPFSVDLKDKVAVVTGAGGVLMSEFAKALCACGAKVALLDIKGRAFPIEIFITDAEFCYKKTEPEKFSNEYAYPYYYGSLGENEFIGLSKKKKQFNSGCYIHY